MKTLLKRFKIYLMMTGIMLCGFTIMAQALSNVPPEEDPPLAVEKIDANFDELKIYTVGSDLKISYEYPEMGNVRIQLFDIAGREIINVRKQKTSTKFEFKHEVKSLPSSIYIVRIFQDNKKITRKLYI
ncbi:MAG: T9SS type A sorting domain-containing protein [Bacteroidota bacterium]|nr:T9SS type A sorting domain-containing protein [Bacteroidota bacterium]